MIEYPNNMDNKIILVVNHSYFLSKLHNSRSIIFRSWCSHAISCKPAILPQENEHVRVFDFILLKLYDIRASYYAAL